MFPLHRAAYQVDIRSLASLITMLVQELMIGAVLGIAARLAISALQVTGAVVAQQLGLGFVTSVDPTLGQQGVIIGNFLAMLGVVLIFATDTHHLVIAALNDSYTLFAPGELPSTGDMAALASRTVAGSFRIGVQLSAPFLVFGILFNLGLGVLSRLMPQMQVFFRRRSAVDPGRVPDPDRRARRHDGRLSRLSAGRAARDRAARVSRPGWLTNKTKTNIQKTRHSDVSMRRSSAAMSPRARRSTPGSSSPLRR